MIFMELKIKKPDTPARIGTVVGGVGWYIRPWNVLSYSTY